jgi:hypothetical protein
MGERAPNPDEISPVFLWLPREMASKEELDAAIKAKGDEIRDLKKAKAEKPVVLAAVEQLLVGLMIFLEAICVNVVCLHVSCASLSAVLVETYTIICLKCTNCGSLS